MLILYEISQEINTDLGFRFVRTEDTHKDTHQRTIRLFKPMV